MPSSSVSNTWPPLSDTSSPSPVRCSQRRQSRRSGVGCSNSLSRRRWRVQGSTASSGSQTGTSHSANSAAVSHSGLNWPLPSNTAQSKGSRWKSTESTSIQALVSCTSISGFRWRKRLRRGSSQRRVRVEGAFRRRVASSTRRAVQARSSASKPSRSPGSSRRAGSVSCNWRPWRSNRRQPKCSSRVRMCRLTALWVIASSSPARVKEACRAAASKARRAYSGGRRRVIGELPLS
ncbi:hypothetical protein PAERUG_E6_London_17_VIM_2_12_12_01964 [Pseudomonas aeruginosa]|nr:hypothetical protein PAERUG_E6_London_17_VIM_2_12_12_01964 [Pseudomonas aeruginosa]